jgi:hypothetical protein
MKIVLLMAASLCFSCASTTATSAQSFDPLQLADSKRYVNYLMVVTFSANETLSLLGKGAIEVDGYRCHNRVLSYDPQTSAVIKDEEYFSIYTPPNGNSSAVCEHYEYNSATSSFLYWSEALNSRGQTKDYLEGPAYFEYSLNQILNYANAGKTSSLTFDELLLSLSAKANGVYEKGTAGEEGYVALQYSFNYLISMTAVSADLTFSCQLYDIGRTTVLPPEGA